MRQSHRAFHSRMGGYSRRRRLLLVSHHLAAEPTLLEEEFNDQILLDPELIKIVEASAQYLNQKSCGVDALMGAASNLIRGKTTGSALLADFPEVECEIVPQKKLVVPEPVFADPESVFSDFEVVAVEADSREAAAETAAHISLTHEKSTSRSAFADLQQIASWLRDYRPRVWMFLGDENTAWMRYQGEAGYAEMFRHRLKWELRRFTDLIVNAGLPSTGMDEFLKIARQGLQKCQPAAVFIMPGRKDLQTSQQKPRQFTQQCQTLVEFLREQQVIPVLQTLPIPPLDQASDLLAPFAQMADLIREMCVLQEVPLIDHAELWLEQPTRTGWFDRAGQNLTTQGQAILCWQFLQELGLIDPLSPLCQKLQTAWQPTALSPHEIPASAAKMVQSAGESDILVS